MSGTAGMITHPIALCAYVLALVFGLLAKMLNSKGKSLDRRLFRLAVFVSVTALIGGLVLAWHQTAQTPASAIEPARKSGSLPPSVESNPPGGSSSQSTTAPNSPNIQNTGGGSVTVQYGGTENHNPGNQTPAKEPTKPGEKKQ